MQKSVLRVVGVLVGVLIVREVCAQECLASSSAVESSGAVARISAGSPAPDGLYPYMASLRSGRAHECGGVLIHPRWILSAASCFSTLSGLYPDQEFPIVLGTHNQEMETGAEKQTGVARLHPDWQGDTSKGHDIALIKLNKPSKISPICLPTSEDISDILGSTPFLTAIGWGRTAPRSAFAKRLQHATNMQLLGQEICSQFVGTTQGLVCAGMKTTQCAGDQGGPLLKRGEPDILVGITTFLSGRQFVLSRCGGGRPGFFTNVSDNLEWIMEEINND